MLKYNELLPYAKKKTNWFKHYSLTLNEKDKSISWGWARSYIKRLRVYPDDKFRIYSIDCLQRNIGDKVSMLSAMPYPVILKKTRSGYTVNGIPWKEQKNFYLEFNANGDCLHGQSKNNPDTDAKHKQFNKFMLNWQRQMIILCKMDPKLTDEEKQTRPDTNSIYELFLQIPSMSIFYHYINSRYYFVDRSSPIENKIKDIKKFRKKYQNALYRKFIDGQAPVIDKWLKENTNCKNS